tara:strand:- start:721 stop:1143 length:423 start_codon:yes stop_codon:yes gene_type:complete
VQRLRFPPASEVASVTELRKLYDEARTEIKNYKAAANMSNISARNVDRKNQQLQKEAKQTNKQLVHLTKKEKLHDEAKKAGAWSAGAAVFTTLLYEMWKVVGFPGGREWRGWWEHEAAYGTVMWMTTCLFAWAYKSLHAE